MIKRLLPILLIPVFITGIQTASAAELKTDRQKFSYTVGFQMGQNLKRQGLDLDVDAFAQAIKDTLAGVQPKMTPEEMQSTMQTFRDKMLAERKSNADANAKAGADFLAANKKKKGVVEMPSGLQYKILQKGSGGKPEAGDTVSVHYRGTLIDGTEFDSSYKRGTPTSFRVGSVIKGWQEGLQLMDVGSKWQLFIPGALAYGEKGAGGSIGPNSTLVFEVELLEIKK